MKRILIHIAVVMILGTGIHQSIQAQQMPLYTQYIFNNFAYNPAIAGTHNYYQIRSNTRVQWVGITDHPLTNVLSVYGPHKEKNMGFGGSLFSDVTGPTSRSGVSGSYAYNLALTEQIRLSMGVSFGLLQYKIDGSNVNLWDEEMDPLQNSVYSKTLPDATIGFYMYTYNYHVGFSATQLLNNRLKFVESDTLNFSGISKLKSHFFLTGGYRYLINKEWAVEGNSVIKYVHPAPIQLELSVKGIYQNKVWGGLAVRTQDALSILIGYIHEKQYHFGYSYDFTFSSIRKYNSGSHEITIGYKFNDIK